MQYHLFFAWSMFNCRQRLKRVSRSYMIGGKLCFMTILRESKGAIHDSCIVHQDMERELLGFEFVCKFGDRSKWEEVQLDKFNIFIFSFGLDFFYSCKSFGRCTREDGDMPAFHCECRNANFAKSILYNCSWIIVITTDQAYLLWLIIKK